MYKLIFGTFLAVGLGLYASAYAGSYTPVPVFATSTYAYGSLTYGHSSTDSNHQYIACAVYPNITQNASTAIECKAHSVAGGNFWCYLVNPSPDMVSAVGRVNANKSSFLQLNSDNQGHCNHVTATTLSASPDRLAQRSDALQPIDAMIAGGPWGIEELIGFHEKLSNLDPQQTELAMQKLAKAISSGGIEDPILSTN